MHEQMKERIRDVLSALTSYRAKHIDNKRLEDVATQIEFVQTAIEENKTLKRGEKDALDFHLVDGTPFENDEHLTTELYSIKNFVMNTL